MIQRKLQTNLRADEIYARVKSKSNTSFILESAEKENTMGRFSFLGFNPQDILSYKAGVLSSKRGNIVTQDPFNELRKVVQAKKLEVDMPGFLWVA